MSIWRYVLWPGLRILLLPFLVFGNLIGLFLSVAAMGALLMAAAMAGRDAHAALIGLGYAWLAATLAGLTFAGCRWVRRL